MLDPQSLGLQAVGRPETCGCKHTAGLKCVQQLKVLPLVSPLNGA